MDFLLQYTVFATSLFIGVMHSKAVDLIVPQFVWLILNNVQKCLGCVILKTLDTGILLLADSTLELQNGLSV